MREKLIELFDKFYEKADETCPRKENISFDCDECKYFSGHYCDWEYRKIDYLLENGIVVLPCKVGDTLYRVYDNNFVVDNYKVDNIMIAKDHITVFDDSGTMYDSEHIGDIVFLTREEAEKHLKGVNNE